VIDAYHLPALAHPPTTTWSYGKGADAFEVRVPRLTGALLREQLRALAEARDEHLAGRPVAEIVEVVDGVAARLLDPADPLRRTAERALPAMTSYSPAMIRHVLDRMAADWRAAPLRELLRAEFGDPRVLDGFHPAPRGRGERMVIGPRLITNVFSGNVPGVAVTALVRALLLKSAALGKTAVGEPLLAALFARGVAEADAGLGACLAVTYWSGGDDEMERAALEAADAVVVYGGADAVASVRARTPAATTFLGYGPKISFGAVGRGALTADAARAAAGVRRSTHPPSTSRGACHPTSSTWRRGARSRRPRGRRSWLRRWRRWSASFPAAPSPRARRPPSASFAAWRSSRRPAATAPSSTPRARGRRGP
jgi:hypothetical protein